MKNFLKIINYFIMTFVGAILLLSLFSILIYILICFLAWEIIPISMMTMLLWLRFITFIALIPSTSISREIYKKLEND